MTLSSLLILLCPTKTPEKNTKAAARSVEKNVVVILKVVVLVVPPFPPSSLFLPLLLVLSSDERTKEGRSGSPSDALKTPPNVVVEDDAIRWKQKSNTTNTNTNSRQSFLLFRVVVRRRGVSLSNRRARNARFRCTL